MQNVGIKEKTLRMIEGFVLWAFVSLFCLPFFFFLIWDIDDKSQEELQNSLSRLSKKTCILKVQEIKHSEKWLILVLIWTLGGCV